jgi:putative polymerase
MIAAVANNAAMREAVLSADREWRIAPALLLIGCVTFNAVLAVVNGHVTALSPAEVIAVEIALVLAALVLALLRWKPQMTPLMAIIVLLTLFAIVRGLLTAQLEPKFLRDVILIPTFMMLGLSFDERGLGRTILVLHTLIFAVFLLEAIAPQAYSGLFRIQDYYVNTRGNRLDEFYNTSSELFINATRPQERFFWFVDAPRLSSIFLEPVSLGNYCTIAVAFMCACYRRLSGPALGFMAVTAIAMIIGSDGRLAAATSVLILILAVVATWLPPRSAALYIPATVAGAFGLVGALGFQPSADDFPGRLAHGVELLKQYDVAEILGASNRYIAESMDSGVAYLITTQSLPGLLLLWAYFAWGTNAQTAEQVRFTHALSLYLALSMLVSYSFLTIKTAAILWFIQGALQGSSGPTSATHVSSHRPPFTPP